MTRATILLALVIACATIGGAISGCSTEPAQTGSILLQFGHKASGITADSLYPPFPNPFSRPAGDTAICIEFAISDSIYSANVLVQNALGDPVANFYDTLIPRGVYSGWWEPLAPDGSPLADGLYFVTLQHGAFIDSRLINIQENE